MGTVTFALCQQFFENGKILLQTISLLVKIGSFCAVCTDRRDPDNLFGSKRALETPATLLITKKCLVCSKG